MQQESNRIIGQYVGSSKGPLLFVFGGMHGNETAGVKALGLIFKMLEVEPIANPAFTFKGKMVGIVGNLAAAQVNQRFISEDLNRMWEKERIDSIRLKSSDNRNSEEKEILEILDVINTEILTYQPDEIFFLDLHTTSSAGGIFSIVNDSPRSIGIAVEMHAPVILGMIDRVKGTTLHYFTQENFNLPTVTVSFESGQHDDPISVNRAIAAMTNYLKIIGCVDARHIENRNDKILIEYSRDLPNVSYLLYSHHIREQDGFRMNPGYQNFQKVSTGEIVAQDIRGNITIPEEGRILMPLYQKQGSDGFFIIKESDSY